MKKRKHSESAEDFSTPIKKEKVQEESQDVEEIPSTSGVKSEKKKKKKKNKNKDEEAPEVQTEPPAKKKKKVKDENADSD